MSKKSIIQRVTKDTTLNHLNTASHINVPVYNTAPPVQLKGSMYYNTTTDNMYISNGIAWQIIASGTGFVDGTPPTTINNLAIWDDITGTLIKNSGITAAGVAFDSLIVPDEVDTPQINNPLGDLMVSAFGDLIMDGTLIPTAAWPFVSTMNQNVATTSTPTFTGLSANNQLITSVLNPITAQDAATKNYVDSLFSTGDATKIVNVRINGNDLTANGSEAFPFATVNAALAYITTNTITNPYEVNIGPGAYFTPTITMKPYVVLKGHSIFSILVNTSGANANLIIATYDTALWELTLVQALAGPFGTGYAVYYDGIGSTATQAMTMIQCRFGRSSNLCKIDGSINNAIFIGLLLSWGGNSPFGTGFEIVDGGVTKAILNLRSCTTSANVIPAAPTYLFKCYGPTAQLLLNDISLITGTPFFGGDCIQIYDGAQVQITSTFITGWGTGVHTLALGAAPTINLIGVNFGDNTVDIQLDHPTTAGTFSGVGDSLKISPMPTPSTFVWVFLDQNDGGLDIRNKLDVTFPLGTTTEVLELSTNQGVGLISGGIITDIGGGSINVSTAVGYLINGSGELAKYTPIGVNLGPFAADTQHYVYVNILGSFTSNSAPPALTTTILCGRIGTDNAGDILFIDQVSAPQTNYTAAYDSIAAEIFGPLFIFGCIVMEGAPLNLDVSNGKYYVGALPFSPSGGVTITFSTFYQDGVGGWTITGGVTVVDTGFYDDGTGVLAAIPGGDYVKHSLYVVGDGANEEYFFVYGQTLFASQLLAEGGVLSTPPTYFNDGIVIIASLIVLSGAAAIASILSERPFPFTQSSATAPVSSHLALTDLIAGNAGHTQFYMLNGTTPLAANMNTDVFAINPSVAGTQLVDGVLVAGHASRHLPLGADALTTAAPSTDVSGTSVNATGIANSFSRSDHQHALSNVTLNKLATGSAAQIIVNNAGGVPTYVAMSGDATISDTGVVDVTLPLSNVLVDGNTTGGTDISVTAGDDILLSSTSNIVETFGSQLRFLESGGSDYVGFQAPSGGIASNVVWRLPAADGISGQVLSTDGLGVLSWIPAAALQNLASVLAVGNTTGGNDISVTAGDDILMSATSNIIETFGSQLRFLESGGPEYVGFQAPSGGVTTSVVWRLPAADGSINQQLTTNGAGVLGWATGVTVAGTVTSSTLRWSGTAWVEDVDFRINSNTLASLADTLILDPTSNTFIITPNTNSDNIRFDMKNNVNSTPLEIYNSAPGVSGPILKLYHDSSSPTANDETGIINFNGNSSTGVERSFARITATTTTVTNAAEDGKLVMNIIKAGTNRDVLTMQSGAITINSDTSATTELRFEELDAGGTNYVGFKAATTLAANTMWTLPTADGVGGQQLTTDGAGVLSWTNSSGLSSTTFKQSTSDFSTSTPVLTNVTGFSYSLAASTTYYVKFTCLVTTASALIGILITINATAAVTSVNLVSTIPTAVTTFQYERVTALQGGTVPTTGPGATQVSAYLEGTIVTSGAVTFTLQARSESGGNAVTVKAGSLGFVQIIS